jgi:hypothetical protein
LETYRYLNEMDISYLHVFKYSERQYWSSRNARCCAWKCPGEKK